MCIWNRFLFETDLTVSQILKNHNHFYNLFACLFNTAHNEIIFRRLCALSDRRVRWYARKRKRARYGKFGGDEEDRTPDPLLARQVLSQLSYTPIFGVPAFSSLRHNRRLPPDIPRFFVLLLALICFAAQVLSSDSFGICQRFLATQ